MPTVTSTLSRNSLRSLRRSDSSAAVAAGMSPAKKFRPVSCTAGILDGAVTNASTSASGGVGEANGHQNSTASKPAFRAARRPLQQRQLGEAGSSS